MFTWGSGQNGVLGHGDRNIRSRPAEVLGIPKVKFIAAGYNHSALLTLNDLPYTWGLGNGGRLGHGGSSTFLVPKKVDQIDDQTITSVSCGYDYTLFVNSNGFVYATGNADSGKTAITPQFNQNCIFSPQMISQKNNFSKISDVVAGFDHTLA